jgi:hypothetical protein
MSVEQSLIASAFQEMWHHGRKTELVVSIHLRRVLPTSRVISLPSLIPPTLRSYTLRLSYETERRSLLGSGLYPLLTTVDDYYMKERILSFQTADGLCSLQRNLADLLVP